MDPRNIISTLQNIREIVQTEIVNVRGEIDYREDEFNDISHLLEFGTFNAVQTCKLARELQESKRIRRLCLNENELLTPLYEYLNKHAGFFNGLEKIGIEIEKKRKKQLGRRYEIRVRDDLREVMEKVQTK